MDRSTVVREFSVKTFEQKKEERLFAEAQKVLNNYLYGGPPGTWKPQVEENTPKQIFCYECNVWLCESCTARVIR